MSDMAESAARLIAREVREQVEKIPTTDAERVAIQLRVAELVGGPRAAAQGEGARAGAVR